MHDFEIVKFILNYFYFWRFQYNVISSRKFKLKMTKQYLHMPNETVNWLREICEIIQILTGLDASQVDAQMKAGEFYLQSAWHCGYESDQAAKLLINKNSIEPNFI